MHQSTLPTSYQAKTGPPKILLTLLMSSVLPTSVRHKQEVVCKQRWTLSLKNCQPYLPSDIGRFNPMCEEIYLDYKVSDNGQTQIESNLRSTYYHVHVHDNVHVFVHVHIHVHVH
jgi:hypothetical protein